MKPLFIEGRVPAKKTFLAATATVIDTAFATGQTVDVWSDQDCYIMVAVNPSTVSVDTGYPLFAGQVIPLTVSLGTKIGVYSANAGTLRWVNTGI